MTGNFVTSPTLTLPLVHPETTVAFGLHHKGLFNRNGSGGIRSRDAHRGSFIDDLMGPVGSNTRGEQDAM